jgi:hypothetical protein
MTRICRDCNRAKPTTEFHVKVRNDDGTPRTFHSYCKPCMVERDRARRRRARAANPKPKRRHPTKAATNRKARERYRRNRKDQAWLERRRAQGREAARRRRADPIAHAKIRAAHERWKAKAYADPRRLADARVAARMNRRKYGEGAIFERRSSKAVEAWKAAGATTDLVDAGPFVRFVRQAFPKADTLEIARVLDMDSSEARRVFDGGQARVSLVLVDRLLTHGLGRPDLVAALYPMDLDVAA